MLPKRVLSVGGTSASPSVVLIETNYLRGHYTTLSHCWGPIEKQPLRTTKDTLASHLNGIPFKSLPKSFQDVVIVTRAIGLDYLWIDSLCIVQEDEIEWAEESLKMGSIYERSRLTIAAADAENSSQGCFIWERRPRVSLHGMLLKPTVPWFYTGPIASPLRRREWALQEWQLSRRIAFFTDEGVWWKCKRIELDPWNQRTNLQQYSSWSSILQRYSECQLTYKSDRLTALDGLATEMQKDREDQYHLGIWTANLPEHLLWTSRLVTPADDDIPELPSWSWASRGGNKVFWSTQYYDWRREVSSNKISILQNVLTIQGSLKRCTVKYTDAIPWDKYPGTWKRLPLRRFS